MRRTLPVICGVVAAAAAVAIPLIVVACGSAPDRTAEAATSPSPSPSAKPSHRFRPYPHVNKPCKGKIPEPFAGIATGGSLAAGVASFRRSTGAHLRVIEVYNSFPGQFHSAQAQQIESLHALPLIQLNPRRISMGLLASGAYDSYIRSYARQVKAFGCYVALSFGHEMNGWWYPWGLPWTEPKLFIGAWRHLHDVFAAVGTRNVIWSWDPTHQHSQFRPGKVAYPAGRFYPGNRYVDWIGFDGYIGAGQNFNEVFSYQLRDIRRLTRKPIYLAETGVGDGAREARQIANLFAGIRSWHLAGLVWFDLNRKNSWSLDGKPTKDAAFRRAIARFP